jgi:hypothetical protein
METQRDKGLFNPGGCLTAQTFRRYLDNDLVSSEKTKVEEHLRHCLICSEAMEGFKRQHHSSINLQKDISMLSGRIRRRYSSRRQVNQGLPVTILISVFVFLILIVIIYYIIRYTLLNP